MYEINRKDILMKLFSQILLEDGSHVTLDFNPGKCVIPSPLKEGEEVTVVVRGNYHDAEIDAEIVSIYRKGSMFSCMDYQPDERTPLHITRRADGVKPVVAGIRARERRRNIVRADRKTKYIGTVCYFESK